MNRDLIEEKSGANIYEFAFSNPVNLYDSDGRIVPVIVCGIVGGATLCGCGGPPPLTPEQIQKKLEEEIERRFARLVAGGSWNSAIAACSYISNASYANATDQAHWVAECAQCAAKKCATEKTLPAAGTCFKRKTIKCNLGIKP